METFLSDIEAKLVGFAIINGKLYSSGKDISPELFYFPEYRHMWSAVLELSKAKRPIDYITVIEEAKKQGHKLKVTEVSSTTNKINIGTKAEFEEYAFLLRKSYIERHSLELMGESYKKMKEPDAYPKDVSDWLAKEIDNLYNFAMPDKEDTNRETPADELQKDVKNIREGRSEPFYSTGFLQIDKIQNGLTPTDLICVAARPGMGKTAFVISVAREMLAKGLPVLIFSLEMPAKQIIARLAAEHAKINAQLIRNPKEMNEYEYRKFDEACEHIKTLPLYIEDTSGVNEEQIHAKVSEHVRKYGIKLVVIDYIQLVTCSTKTQSREQQISQISRKFKIIAKDCELPVIELSQLSRAVESRGGDKIPILADLRESGAIEQDADIVSFLYRPAYYNITRDENGNDLSKVVKYVIAKNRNGPLQHVFIYFDELTTAMHDSKLKIVELEHRTDEHDDLFKIKSDSSDDDDSPF